MPIARFSGLVAAWLGAALFASPAPAQTFPASSYAGDPAHARDAPEPLSTDFGLKDPFAAGTWTINVYGAGVIGSKERFMYTAHGGFTYYIFDNIGVSLEGFLGGAISDNPGDPDLGGDAFVGGFDLFARWNFVTLDEGAVSFFLDGGAGFQLASADFPSDSIQNFRTFAGLGVSWRVCDNLRVIGGARYIHISNAGTSDINDGLDGALVFLGVQWPM